MSSQILLMNKRGDFIGISMELFFFGVGWWLRYLNNYGKINSNQTIYRVKSSIFVQGGSSARRVITFLQSSQNFPNCKLFSTSELNMKTSFLQTPMVDFLVSRCIIRPCIDDIFGFEKKPTSFHEQNAAVSKLFNSCNRRLAIQRLHQMHQIEQIFLMIKHLIKVSNSPQVAVNRRKDINENERKHLGLICFQEQLQLECRELVNNPYQQINSSQK